MAQSRAQLIARAFTPMVGGRLTNALTNRNAVPIQEVYDTVVDAACMAQRWPWTIDRVELTDRDPAPGQPERYRFTMPLGPSGDRERAQAQPRLSVGPIALYNTERGRRPLDDRAYRVSMQYIYTEEEALWGTFQFRTPEEGWPAQFYEYVRLLLMAETIAVYKPDTGVQEAEILRARATQMEGNLSNTTAQVIGAEPMFDEFATTASRFGGGIEYEPIALNEEGRAL